ncbi:hypothetical protein [Xanthomonas citri]|uniref:hypothetical protein n=1 Tax=Xanthomonas citri TaxID=346 RepID=UPI0012FF3584|nr:hypothetical protein [Xanthomonas citri]
MSYVAGVLDEMQAVASTRVWPIIGMKGAAARVTRIISTHRVGSGRRVSVAV